MARRNMQKMLFLLGLLSSVLIVSAQNSSAGHMSHDAHMHGSHMHDHSSMNVDIMPDHSSITETSENNATGPGRPETEMDHSKNESVHDHASMSHHDHAKTTLEDEQGAKEKTPMMDHDHSHHHMPETDMMQMDQASSAENRLNKKEKGDKNQGYAVMFQDDGHGGHDGHDGHGGHDGHDGHGGHDGHDMHNNGSGGGGMMHGMKMYFHTGVEETVLFEQWQVKNVAGMVGSVIGIILLAMFYEGLKYFREYLFKQYVSSMQFSTVAVTGESGRVTQVHKVERHRILSAAHGIQTCLHVIQMVISYFLMLIFMTYNIWLCIAVITGAGLGYFIFGWKKATVVDITEHCH